MPPRLALCALQGTVPLPHAGAPPCLPLQLAPRERGRRKPAHKPGLPHCVAGNRRVDSGCAGSGDIQTVGGQPRAGGLLLRLLQPGGHGAPLSQY